MQELLETDQARAIVEAAEERGYLEAPELEAFALEHELGEVDVEELTRELERIGLEIREPEVVAVKEPEKEKDELEPIATPVPTGAGDSLQL
ncbi:MAG: hypothetical protein M3168_06180, partial [Actinomycetota bacterium]|nr:hypothetical protein [Actinomycetota bacterium]